MPFDNSASDSGKSTAILMVPLLAVPLVLVPQAARARLTTASPASNLGNLIRVLLPNVNTSRIRCARRRSSLYNLAQAPATNTAILLIPINNRGAFCTSIEYVPRCDAWQVVRGLDNAFDARVGYTTHSGGQALAEFAERIKPRAQYVDEAIELALASKWTEAVQVNRGIMDRFGPDEDTLNRLGKSYTELGQFENAIDAYKSTLKLNPVNPIAVKNLAKLQALRGGQ